MGRDRRGLQGPVVVVLSAFQAAALLDQRREPVATIRMSGWKFVEFSDVVRGLGGTCDAPGRTWTPPPQTTALFHLRRRVPYLLNHDQFREGYLLALPRGEEFLILERPEWSTGTLVLEAFPVLQKRPLAAPQGAQWAT